jgi:hypothetical protein
MHGKIPTCTMEWIHLLRTFVLYSVLYSTLWAHDLGNNSYKSITNTAWVRARLCKLQKGCTRLTAGSNKVYQLLAHSRWFSPGTLASSTTKSVRHDLAEILLKVALYTKNKIKIKSCILLWDKHIWIKVALIIIKSIKYFVEVRL